MSKVTPETANGRSIVHSFAKKSQQWVVNSAGTIAVVFIVVIAWEALTELHIQNNAYLPSASFTLDQSWSNRDMIWSSAIETFSAFMIAYPIAVLLGIGLGILFAESFIARQSSMPMLIFAYAIPHAILAPMFMIWFGLGFRGTAAFAVWIAFFPVFVNTLTSMSTIDPEMKKLGEITGATQWQQVRYLKFWKALPDIISGMRISVQMAVVGVIVAEFLGGADGLGRLIDRATYTGRLGLTFGAVITIGLGAMIVFKGISWMLNFIDPSTRGESQVAGGE